MCFCVLEADRVLSVEAKNRQGTPKIKLFAKLFALKAIQIRFSNIPNNPEG
jgi:hypothetical protein